MPAQKPGRSKQDYPTPQDLMNAIKRRLGISAFTMDFAADVHNTKAPKFWSVTDDSLAQSEERWAQRVGTGWGWLNPPYTDIRPWAARCLGSGARIALLVPASVGSNWYRDFIHGQFGVTVLFMNGRVSFDGKNCYPKDTMIVLFGGDTAFTTDVWTWK